MLKFLAFFTVVLSISCQLSVEVDEGTGNYLISVAGEKWFKSSEIGLSYRSKWFSNDKDNKNQLALQYTNITKEHDVHGDFTKYRFVWNDISKDVNFITILQVYIDIPAVVFEQVFPTGSADTSINHDLNDLISVFPSFEFPAINDKLKFLTYMDTHSLPMYGHWGDILQEIAYKGGMNFGPICFYNEQLEALLLSSFSNFMLGSCIRDRGNLKKNFGCGVQGMVENVPARFSHKTVMFYSNGINDVFESWGDFMLLEFGNKKRVTVDDDIFLSHLTYYTDRGAYYYHPLHEVDVEPTILEIDQYTKEHSIPIKSIQYDAWWVQSNQWGMYLWEPNNISFPHGMKYVFDKTELPTVLWSTHFSKENYYSEVLNFTFHVDEKTGYALPNTKEMYKYVMSRAKSGGMSCFEHDFLTFTYTNSDFLQKDTFTASGWMNNLTDAADELGLTVQLCMVFPFIVLKTLESNVVTHVRASTDYMNREQLCLNQWNIALASMYYYSVGVMPHKDNWWSSGEVEEGCQGYQTCHEKNPILQAVTSTLSNGPVAISDRMGSTDVELIHEIVRPDGYILRPDKPLMPVDEVFRYKYHDVEFTVLRNIHSTETCLEEELCWYYLFFNDVFEDFELKPSLFVPKKRKRNQSQNFLVMEYILGQGKISTFTIINETSPMIMKRSKFEPVEDVIDFKLYQIAQLDHSVVCGEVVLLKEMKKISFMSKGRITKYQCLKDNALLMLDIQGVEDEKITFAFLKDDSMVSIFYLDCVFSSSGSSIITCSQGKCSC